MQKLKIVLSVIIVLTVTLSLFALTVPVFAAAKNIAEGAAVEANSYIADDQAPEFAVDADVETKWCSVAPVDGTRNEYWLIVDLGAEKSFDKYAIQCAPKSTIDADYPQYVTNAFRVEYSNDKKTWTKINQVDNNEANDYSFSFKAVKSRYVRLYILKPTTDENDIAVRLPEFEIYEAAGASGGNATQQPSSATTTAAATTTTAPAETTQAPSEEVTTAPAETTAAPADTTAAVSDETTEPSATNTSNDPQNGPSILIFIVIGVVVIAGAGAAFFFIKKKKNG